MFRSCGEADVGDAGGVVAGEVTFAAVAVLVVGHVLVEVAVDDDGAELENVLGTVRRPSRSGNSESAFDYESACSLDHASSDGPAFGQGLVVVHVLVVVAEVGDGLVQVGEVEVPLAGVRTGLRRDGGEGGGDRSRAAAQDAQELPVGPLACGDGVCRVQAGGSLADVAAEVDVVDEDRDLELSPRSLVSDGGGLVLVPVDEVDPLPFLLRVAAAGLVERRADHGGDVAGDGR